MRLTLVVLYFAALYLMLRPAPHPDPAGNAAPQTASLTGPSRSGAEAVATSPWPGEASGLSPAPPMPVAAEAMAGLADTARPMGTLERAGEEHTSVHAAPRAGLRDEGVESLVQNELVRLACLTGKPESKWGKKSRTALRRFTQRAKAKDGAADEALLRTLRDYPANYCRLCRPGQAACDVQSTGAIPQRSDGAPVGR